jgi:hypothetical protein
MEVRVELNKRVSRAITKRIDTERGEINLETPALTGDSL